MGFLYLAIATLLNLTKSYCSKKISDRVESVSDTVDMTMLRNGLCTVIGAVLILLIRGGDFRIPLTGLVVCILSGAVMGLNYVVWVLALKSGVYLLASASNSASFIIAALSGIFLFGEDITPAKIAAIALILSAIFFMSLYQKEQRGKLQFIHALLLLSVFLTAGISSVTQKWFTKNLPDTSVHLFTFYSLVISLAVLIPISLFLPNKKTFRKRVSGLKRIFPTVTVMAVCFYSVTYFQTLASSLIDAVVMYPVYNGALLAAGSLMAWLCFSERPSRNSIIGIVLVFAAIVLSRF